MEIQLNGTEEKIEQDSLKLQHSSNNQVKNKKKSTFLNECSENIKLACELLQIIFLVSCIYIQHKFESDTLKI